MPTYDYECESCGHTFEAFQSMSDDPLSVCPECETPALRRLITGGTGIIFKGSGFYVNDSRKTGSGGGSSSSRSSSSEKSSAGEKTATGSDGGTKGSSGGASGSSSDSQKTA